MFQPGEIVYGFVSGLGFRNPKNKYLITLYRDDDLEVVACFTTSQHYYGVSPEQVKHGPIIRDGEYYCYVFEKGIVIGKNPEDDSDFSFPLRTTVTFNYGIRHGQMQDFAEGMQDLKTVCVLNKEEFGNLLYAMYKSPEMDNAYKPFIEKSLTALYAES